MNRIDRALVSLPPGFDIVKAAAIVMDSVSTNVVDVANKISGLALSQPTTSVSESDSVPTALHIQGPVNAPSRKKTVRYEFDLTDPKNGLGKVKEHLIDTHIQSD